MPVLYPVLHCNLNELSPFQEQTEAATRSEKKEESPASVGEGKGGLRLRRLREQRRLRHFRYRHHRTFGRWERGPGQQVRMRLEQVRNIQIKKLYQLHFRLKSC